MWCAGSMCTARSRPPGGVDRSASGAAAPVTPTDDPSSSGVGSDDELLAQLRSVPAREAAELLSMLPMEQAVRLVQQLRPPAVAELLMALPTAQRVALQEVLGPQSYDGAVGSDYHRAAEVSLGRVATGITWLAPRVGILLIEVFGRSVQVALRDWPDRALGPPDVHAAVVGVDWRRA